MFFQSGDVNSPDVVVSARTGYVYQCPDIESVDRYIVRLVNDYLGPNSNASEQVKEFARQDIDRLLDHRSYLHMVAA